MEFNQSKQEFELTKTHNKKNKEILAASSSNKPEVCTITASDKLDGSLLKVISKANKITTAALSTSYPILMPSQDSHTPMTYNPII